MPDPNPLDPYADSYFLPPSAPADPENTPELTGPASILGTVVVASDHQTCVVSFPDGSTKVVGNVVFPLLRPGDPVVAYREADGRWSLHDPGWFVSIPAGMWPLSALAAELGGELAPGLAACLRQGLIEHHPSLAGESDPVLAAEDWRKVFAHVAVDAPPQFKALLRIWSTGATYLDPVPFRVTHSVSGDLEFIHGTVLGAPAVAPRRSLEYPFNLGTCPAEVIAGNPDVTWWLMCPTSRPLVVTRPWEPRRPRFKTTTATAVFGPELPNPGVFMLALGAVAERVEGHALRARVIHITPATEDAQALVSVEVYGVRLPLRPEQVTWDTNASPLDRFRPGQEVRVTVTLDLARFALGITLLRPQDPEWETASELHPVGSRLTGASKWMTTQEGYMRGIEFEGNKQVWALLPHHTLPVDPVLCGKVVSEIQRGKLDLIVVEHDTRRCRLSLGWNRAEPQHWPGSAIQVGAVLPVEVVFTVPDCAWVRWAPGEVSTINSAGLARKGVYWARVVEVDPVARRLRFSAPTGEEFTVTRLSNPTFWAVSGAGNVVAFFRHPNYTGVAEGDRIRPAPCLVDLAPSGPKVFATEALAAVGEGAAPTPVGEPTGAPGIAEAWAEIVRQFTVGERITGRVYQKRKECYLIDTIPSINKTYAHLTAGCVVMQEYGIKYNGRVVQAVITDIDEEKKRLVVSYLQLAKDHIVENDEFLSEFLSKLAIGQIRRGIVKKIVDYGAYVDLGGIDGRLNIADMGWHRVTNPHDVVKIDQEIEVYILHIDREKKKIALSLKHKTPSPWQNIEQKYPVATRHQGEVVNIMPYGVFVTLEPGIEGLVHISEMSWVKRIADPKELVQIGDKVEVQVLNININHDKKEIALSMKQCRRNPWSEVAKKYPPGTVITGTVRNLTNYAAFVEIEEGVVGFLHITDMSWTRKVSNPSEVVQKGQKTTCQVLSVDQEQKRLALGIKQMMKDPWEEGIPGRYKPGQKVTGKVTKLTNFGVFVELEPELEGLLHSSELSDAKIESPEEVVKVGDDVEVKVLRVDTKDRKISLSMKNVDDGQVPMPAGIDAPGADSGPVPVPVGQTTRPSAIAPQPALPGSPTEDAATSLASSGVELRFPGPADVGAPAALVELTGDRAEQRAGTADEVATGRASPPNFNAHPSAAPPLSVEQMYPVGTRHRGRVMKHVPYGVFVRLSPGVEGLVHISELSWVSRVTNPKDIVSIGDQVEVQIMEIKRNDIKYNIALSIRQCQDNIWNDTVNKISVGMLFTGIVQHIVRDYSGAYIQILNGLDGYLILNKNYNIVTGQNINCMIKHINHSEKKIELIQVDSVDNTPADTAIQPMTVQPTVSGERGPSSRGAVVEFGGDVGSDSRGANIDTGGDVVPPSRVVLTSQASTPAVSDGGPGPDETGFGAGRPADGPPVAQAPGRYPVGCTTTGKVTMLTDFGVFVELEAGLEGFIHISELPVAGIDGLGELVQVGDDVEVQVLRAHTNEGNISLSMKGVGDGLGRRQRGHSAVVSDSDGGQIPGQPAAKPGPTVAPSGPSGFLSEPPSADPVTFHAEVLAPSPDLSIEERDGPESVAPLSGHTTGPSDANESPFREPQMTQLPSHEDDVDSFADAPAAPVDSPVDSNSPPPQVDCLGGQAPEEVLSIAGLGHQLQIGHAAPPVDAINARTQRWLDDGDSQEDLAAEVEDLGFVALGEVLRVGAGLPLGNWHPPQSWEALGGLAELGYRPGRLLPPGPSTLDRILRLVAADPSELLVFDALADVLPSSFIVSDRLAVLAAWLSARDVPHTIQDTGLRVLRARAYESREEFDRAFDEINALVSEASDNWLNWYRSKLIDQFEICLSNKSVFDFDGRRFKRVGAEGAEGVRSGSFSMVIPVEGLAGDVVGRFALKHYRLRPWATGEMTRALELFTREADILRRVAHPNVVRLVEQLDRGAILLEWVRGVTLDHEIAVPSAGHTSRWPAGQVIDLGFRVADGLRTAAAAIGQEFAHADLHPGNLMVDRSRYPDPEWVKLIDFGLSRGPQYESLAALADEVVFDKIAGYRALEVTRGGQHSVRTDAYSLGAIMYELLTGHLPLPGPDLAPGLGLQPAVSRLLTRMLSTDPESRPESWDEIVEVLGKHLPPPGAGGVGSTAEKAG